MKPESTFIRAVHSFLSPDVYREKMHNPLRRGTPDCYYMGFAETLWVEYKWHPKDKWKHITPDLSGLQKAWLMRAYDRGQEPWVVVGFPTGCIILLDPRAWQQGVDRGDRQVLTKHELARRIEARCGLEGSPGSQPVAGTSTP